MPIIFISVASGFDVLLILGDLTLGMLLLEEFSPHRTTTTNIVFISRCFSLALDKQERRGSVRFVVRIKRSLLFKREFFFFSPIPCSSLYYTATSIREKQWFFCICLSYVVLFWAGIFFIVRKLYFRKRSRLFLLNEFIFLYSEYRRLRQEGKYCLTVFRYVENKYKTISNDLHNDYSFFMNQKPHF